MIDRGRALELVAQEKSLDLAFEAIADLLVCLFSLFCTDIVFLISIDLSILLHSLFLQLPIWHLSRKVYELMLFWYIFLL